MSADIDILHKQILQVQELARRLKVTKGDLYDLATINSSKLCGNINSESGCSKSLELITKDERGTISFEAARLQKRRKSFRIVPNDSENS
jgi:hypothetical protein